MVFKIIGRVNIGIMLALSSCSRAVSPSVGSPLKTSTPLYTASGISASHVFQIDQPSSRILRVNLDSFAIDKAFALAASEAAHTLAGSPTGQYVIDFSPRHLELIAVSGERTASPFVFQGTPISAAFQSDLGLFVMQDDLSSLGVMKISESGKLESSWLGGSLIAADKSLAAADIVADGSMIAATSDGSLLKILLEASITQKKWVSESVSLGITGVNTVSPDAKYKDFVFLVATDSVVIVRLADLTVVDKVVLSSAKLERLWTSKGQRPHVIVRDLATGEDKLLMMSSDGKLETHVLPASDLSSIAESFLNLEGDTLTILDNNKFAKRVVRMRLTDNLVLLDKNFETSGEISLGSTFVFVNRKADLGYLQKFNFSDLSMQEIKAYNLPFFQSE